MLSDIALWLSHHQFPCMYKQLFGFSCPMCGGQRAIILLFQGEIWESVKMFPPLFPLIFSLLWYALAKITRSSALNAPLTRLLVANAVILIANCIYQNIVH